MQALRNEPLTVYGDGKQTRSFQYVSDLVDNIMFFVFFFHLQYLSSWWVTYYDFDLAYITYSLFFNRISFVA